MKNLVLPGKLSRLLKPERSLQAGISSFTILSDRMATAQDVATNFFLTVDSVGKPIADETVKCVPFPFKLAIR